MPQCIIVQTMLDLVIENNEIFFLSGSVDGGLPVVVTNNAEITILNNGSEWHFYNNIILYIKL